MTVMEYPADFSGEDLDHRFVHFRHSVQKGLPSSH